MIAFLDACALIYLIEGVPPFADKVRAELAAVSQEFPSTGVALSRLSWLECRVGPMRENNHVTLAAFDTFFSQPDLIWQELTRDVVELAAAIRVRHGLRTPDALQAASCLQLGSGHVFFSGDNSFDRVAGLNVRRLNAG